MQPTANVYRLLFGADASAFTEMRPGRLLNSITLAPSRLPASIHPRLHTDEQKQVTLAVKEKRLKAMIKAKNSITRTMVDYL